MEETGIDAGAYGNVSDWQLSNVYEIYPRWRGRYPPGTTRNTEHVFGLEVPAPVPVSLNPREHLAHVWLPWQEAAPKCFSWSNRAAIEELPRRLTAARSNR
jgi:dATP pyrophosphohydrolase